jgi:hypothetical protein
MAVSIAFVLGMILGILLGATLMMIALALG